MVVQLDTMKMMPLIIMLLGKTSMQTAMEFIRFNLLFFMYSLVLQCIPLNRGS